MATETAQPIPDKLCIRCGRQFPANATKCPKHKDFELTEVSKDPLAGTAVRDIYEIISLIGLGGTSLVYKARHKLMDRLVAIKILSSEEDRDALRLQQEARAASALNHPNVVNIFDLGFTPEGKSFIIMEYLEGTSLASLVDEGRHMPYERAVNIFDQVCDAMEQAHMDGIVHLDLKPSNIVLSSDKQGRDIVKVVDFGIAKLMPWAHKDKSKLIEDGRACGSPLYMSPEQFINYEVDMRSDVYSLGATMYEVLTGKPPFEAESIEALVTKKLVGSPPAFKKSHADLYIPDQLQQLVLKALSADKKNRQHSMSEIKRELELVRSPIKPGKSTEDRTISLMIVDDNPVTRLGLHSQLNKISDFEVKGEAETGQQAIDQIGDMAPDVVLMDIEMPVLDGIEATRRIKRKDPSTRVIIFTVHDDEEAILAAFGAGADGYCVKQQEAQLLESGIRSVAHGSSWLDSEIASRVLRACAHTFTSFFAGQETAAEVIPDVAPREGNSYEYLLELAEKSYNRGKYFESESFYRGALAIIELDEEADERVKAKVLTRLADVCYQQDNPSEAESLYLRALNLNEKVMTIDESKLSSDFTHTSIEEGKEEELNEAQKLYLASLMKKHNLLSSVKTEDLKEETISKLAWVFRAQKKYREAAELENVSKTHH